MQPLEHANLGLAYVRLIRTAENLTFHAERLRIIRKPARQDHQLVEILRLLDRIVVDAKRQLVRLFRRLPEVPVVDLTDGGEQLQRRRKRRRSEAQQAGAAAASAAGPSSHLSAYVAGAHLAQSLLLRANQCELFVQAFHATIRVIVKGFQRSRPS